MMGLPPCALISAHQVVIIDASGAKFKLFVRKISAGKRFAGLLSAAGVAI
jgi:hypothetical protein